MNGIPDYINEIENLKKDQKFKEAIEYTKSILKLNTNDYRLYEELADIHLFLRKFEDAKKFLKIALSINPESATGKYLNGYIEVTTGNPKNGIKDLEDANKLNPNNPEVLRNLGWGYVMSNNPIKGIAILKRALNLLEGDPLIIEDLGVALANTGNFEEAKFYLKKINRENILDNFN